MKITKTVAVPREELYAFISNNIDDLLEVTDVDIDTMITTFLVTKEVTEPTFNMQNLHDIAKENNLTLEQQNAIDYGISAIKTLIDMGVLA